MSDRGSARNSKFKLALSARIGAIVFILIVPCLAQPATNHVDLTALGYTALSTMARRSDKVNLSIDFIDNDHLLVTFNPKRMFRRLPECPATHDDRLMEAAVVDIATGQALHHTTWYLHDGRPYLWPLGSRAFLLRRLNSLYVLDATLQEKLLFTSPVDLLWVTVTPDGKRIIDEISEDGAATKAGTSSPKIRLEFRDSQTLVVERVVKLDKEIPLEATSSGFASVIAGFSGKVWLVRFGPTRRQRENIARVRTDRVPDVLYPNSNTLLIGRDSATIPGYSISAFDVTGQRLWRQHWDKHQYSPVVQRSEDGSRFAISTLRPIDVPVPEDAAEESFEGVVQSIQVFNTASGELLLGTEGNPVFANGRNFALSPDGCRLVVLRGTVLQFYDLRPMSPNERTKYMALKAVAPGLDAAVQSGTAEQTPVVSSSGESDRSPQHAQTEGTATTASAMGVGAAVAPDQLVTDPSTAASAEPVVTFKSRRQIVGLDVVVTDSAGRPMRGISRENFQIKEDGKTQTVSNFSEVNDDAVGQPTKAISSEHASKSKSPNIFSTDSPAEVEGGVTVILYDLLNTPAPEQQSAKSALIDFIQHKPRNARFALCALSEGLRMIQGFTPDEGILVRSLKSSKNSVQFSSMKTQDANDEMLISWLVAGAQKTSARLGARGGAGAGMLTDAAGRLKQEQVQRHDRDLELRMAITTDAFTLLARHMAALPGRKSIIWLSGSFPLGVFPGMDFRNPYAENPNNSGQMKQTVNLLAESQVAVYPVDVRGLTAVGLEDTLDATQPTQLNQTSDNKRFDELSNLNSVGAIGSTALGNTSPFTEEVIEHGLMRQIAEDTGGKAFYNGNSLQQAMTVAMEQQANYYELSYTPTNKKYDGKFRRIKVSLAADKRLHVIHRSGYFAVDPDSPVQGSRDAGHGFGLAAMQAGAPQARQLMFEVRAVPLGKPSLVPDPRPAAPVKRKKGHGEGPQLPPLIEVQRYALDYAVSPSQLQFEATSDGSEHGEMNFMAASFASDGSMRTSIASHAKGDLSPAAYQDVLAGGFRMHQEVDVPIAASSLRVGVQDTTTGRMGTLEIRLPVPALPGVEVSRTHRLPEIEPD